MKKEFKKSEYSTTIGITPDHKEAINSIKGKKTMAGKLKEVIDFYLTEKKLWKTKK